MVKVFVKGRFDEEGKRVSYFVKMTAKEVLDDGFDDEGKLKHIYPSEIEEVIIMTDKDWEGEKINPRKVIGKGLKLK